MARDVSIVLGNSESLTNNGPAVQFQVIQDGQIFPAFAIRHNDGVRSFLNVCPHAGLKLNRESNELFHREKDYLFCNAHGAGFDPDTGDCLIGPCLGYSLISLDIVERGNDILFKDRGYEYYTQPEISQ